VCRAFYPIPPVSDSSRGDGDVGANARALLLHLWQLDTIFGAGVPFLCLGGLIAGRPDSIASTSIFSKVSYLLTFPTHIHRVRA